MNDYIDEEYAAWRMLQWVPYSVPSEFSDELAAKGHYTKLQRQRSDEALDQWEANQPPKSMSELDCFRELERIGVYDQSIFYLPTKAKNGVYSARLKDHKANGRLPARDAESVVKASEPRDTSAENGIRVGPSRADAQQSGRTWRPRRRKR